MACLPNLNSFAKSNSVMLPIGDAKLNRGEKKCRKALTKLGMKQLGGITRVTIKKRDGFIFMINDPEVLISGDNGNQFVVFGELKYDDPNQRLQAAEA